MNYSKFSKQSEYKQRENSPSKSKKEIKNKLSKLIHKSKKEDNDTEYSITFKKQPFGIEFKNRTPFLHELSKEGVFVENVEKNSTGYGKIIIGSKLAKIGNISVDEYSPPQIMSMFKTMNKNILPLTLTFQKPAKVETDHVNHKNGLYNIEARAVFIDINEFYKLWRTLSSDVLLNAILILPNINYQWILKPKKLRRNKYKKMLSDAVFQNLLQWKYEQGLLFTVDRQNDKKSFWYYVSNQLMDLSDPSTFNTTNYIPLKLNINEYKNKCFRYNVTLIDIQNELLYLKMNKNAMKEILYQSNPSLQIYEPGRIFEMNRDRSGSTLSTLNDEDVDDMLNEIALVWDNCDSKIEYIE